MKKIFACLLGIYILYGIFLNLKIQGFSRSVDRIDYILVERIDDDSNSESPPTKNLSPSLLNVTKSVHNIEAFNSVRNVRKVFVVPVFSSSEPKMAINLYGKNVSTVMQLGDSGFLGKIDGLPFLAINGFIIYNEFSKLVELPNNTWDQVTFQFLK